MFYIKNKVIYITKADDAVIKVDIKTSTGAAYVMKAGDKLILTVRYIPDPLYPILIRAVSDCSSILIPSASTRDITPGEYSCDIQLSSANNQRYTLYPEVWTSTTECWANFIVLPEVTIE